MLMQYGFSTKSVNQENSGMLYDNVVLEAIGDAGGGGGGGSEPAGGGTGYGVAIIDTDGSIVSGNRFVAGANAWVAANGASLGPVSGMSIVDNTFAGSTAGTDIALGADTANGVVGSGQNSPTYSDDGSNDVLEGSPVSTDTDAMTTEISAQFALEWALITGQ